MNKKIYKHDKVYVKSYDPRVKKYFSKEKNHLLKTLGKGYKIYHIGSTAIPGLGGKNIVDMMLLTSNKRKAKSIAKILKSIGYNLIWNVPDSNYRIFFNCNRKFSGKNIHMHLNVLWKTSNKYKNYLLFVDYLRKHKKEADRYYLLKKEWSKKSKHAREKYTKMKIDYVNDIITKAKGKKYN